MGFFGKNAPLKWFYELSVPHKLRIVTVLIAVLAIIGALIVWFGAATLSSMRAYVGGEGRWSSAQKNAVYSLQKYTQTQNEEDYQTYLKYLEVPLGDSRARIELDKPDTDYAVVREGFLAGKNAPEDIPGLIFLFEKFRHISYMENAITTWEQGDQLIGELQTLGEEIHAGVAPEATSRLNELNNELTILEEQFSRILGEASRDIKTILLFLSLLFFLGVGVAAVVITWYIHRVIARIDETKTNFISIASHELRNPVTALGLDSEILLSHYDEMPEARKKEHVQKIYETYKHLVTLLEHLLSVSRLELGVFTPHRERIDVQDILARIIGTFKEQIEEKKVMVYHDVGENVSSFHYDAQFLEMIFTNLISNAIHYTPEGKEVHITVERENEREVLISVTDKGMGIPKEEQPYIFEKLFRAKNSRMRRKEGLGLGLYIVHSVVKESGGKIWFTSAEGQGTTFFVLLPDE